MPYLNSFTESTISNYKNLYNNKFKDKDKIFEFNYWYLKLSINLTALNDTKPINFSQQLDLVNTLKTIIDNIQMSILTDNVELYKDL